ncbi:MAG: heat-shock protein Hsp20 [Deltaproteobacteria bacterium]|nr:MAG: heat-shock protein Hsp20 [Deltaproteobacteria bacterium]
MALLRFIDRPQFPNPWLEFERLRRGLDELSRGLPGGQGVSRATIYPALNLYEQDEELILTAELPGFKADDLDIAYEGDSLTLQGKRDPYEHAEQVSFHRRELEWGSFSRTLSLPVKVDPDRISAALKDGVLTIRLAKAAEARPRQINIMSQ